MHKIIFKSLKTYLTVFILVTAAQLKAQTMTADPLTGRAVVKLPIWTVNSGDQAVDISLNYSGNGIKVNEGEGTAGMGWSLGFSGILQREVRSLPDDFVGAKSGAPSDPRNGWLHGNIARQINSFVPSDYQSYSIKCMDGQNDFATLNTFAYLDTEPDIFSFNAPGLSGRFLFDKNKVIQTMPYQDLKIQVTRGADSLINQVVITNNQGVKYTFSAGDKVTRLTTKWKTNTVSCFNQLYNLYCYDYPKKYSATYYSSWYLTQIASPSGGNLAFTYGSSYNIYYPDYKQVVNATTNKIDTLFTDYYSISSQLLQTVTGSNEKATITWTGSLVSSVSISDLTYQNLVKKFNLQYHYVLGSVKVKSKPKRAFLSGFNEELNCNSFPGYQFNYYGVNFAADTTSLPFASSIRQDIYGYYDSTAKSAVPEVYISAGDAATDGERYRTYPATNYSLMASGGSRAVDPTKVYFGSLKTITLPTGGTTTYTYEPADYRDILANTNALGAGVRVKSIKTKGGDPSSDVVSSFKYRSYLNPSASSGQWIYRPMFVTFDVNGNAIRVPNNLAPDELILYSRVEVSTTGKGRTVYDFQNSAMYSTTSLNDFNATQSRIARDWTHCTPVANMRWGYYTAPYAPNTNYDIERGLPLRITDYSKSGKIVRRKSYTYQRTTLPIAQVSGVRLEQKTSMFQFGKYTLLSNVDKITLTESEKMYDQSYTDSTTQFVETIVTSTYNANQMLSKQAFTNSDNSSFSKTFKYAKDYPSTGTDTQSQMINALVSNNRHGTVIETQTLNGTSVTGAALTLFNNTYGLSRILPSAQLILGDPTGFSASTVSGTTFNYSPNYYATNYFDAYDALGHPTIVRDENRTVKSIFYGYNNSFAALEVTNTRTDQMVYSDFEPTLNTSVVSSMIPTNTDSWSGQYSLHMNGTSTVQQNAIVRGIGKNYRFSCWAKASSTVTLSVSINGTVRVSGSYPNASATTGTWQYIELMVDMSSIEIGAIFNFGLTSSGNINIDNLAFYPETATLLAHSFDPLNGKTADLDSRGNASFKDYDLMGRARYLRNVDKDIVQINDYHYNASNGILPVSTFTGSPTPFLGNPSTYIANSSCVPGVTYTWYVDDVMAQSGSSLSFTYTPAVNKDFRIKLIASAEYGASFSEMQIHPVGTFSVSIVSNGYTYNSCIDPYGGARTFVATVTNCYDPTNITYAWYKSLGSGTPVLVGTSTTNTYTLTLTPDSTNTIYCVASSNCTNLSTNYVTPIQSQSNSLPFTWITRPSRICN